MTGSHNEDPRLHELLSNAVSDVEPQDRLASIRNRTEVSPMSSRRPWLLGAGGAVVATAAIITAIAFAGGNLGGSDDEPGPAAGEGQTALADPTPTSGGETGSLPPSPETDALPVYYVGDSPQGPRLFREFRASSADDELVAALSEATAGTPMDPDYRTLWPSGEPVVTGATDEGDVIRVELDPDSLTTLKGLSKQESGLAVQQVVYTAQAVVQKRTPVQFEAEGEPVDQVYGVTTSSPVKNASVLDTLSMMSITTPTEGQEVSGKFTATGANNGFEANVQWEVLKDGKEVKSGFTTAAGWMEPKLFPWKTKVDVSGLEPGEYTFRAHNDDPSGGSEGSVAHVDTRTIVVK